MPETTDYMLMGYIGAAIILVVTIGSIWWRYQSLKRDEALIAQLEQEESETSPASTTRGAKTEKSAPATSSDKVLDKMTG
jgi:hypothetical protein